MRKQFLEAGKIVSTQGVRGELRVQPWCDSAAFLCQFQTLYFAQGEQPVQVLSARVHKNLALLKLEGVTTVEQADLLRGKVLYLNRDDCSLEPGRYFIQDLLGLHVLDADTGDNYGTISDVFPTGANDVYEVTGSDGRRYLIPVIPDVVLQVQPEQGRVLIRPMKGIFDDED